MQWLLLQSLFVSAAGLLTGWAVSVAAAGDLPSRTAAPSGPHTPVHLGFVIGTELLMGEELIDHEACRWGHSGNTSCPRGKQLNKSWKNELEARSLWGLSHSTRVSQELITGSRGVGVHETR